MKFSSLILILSFSVQSMAWISTGPTEKQYSFKFKLKGETYEYSQASGSYEEAFEKAAQACYRHYKGGKRLTEDQGLDIIDVCANPRTS